jgi:hypothetical protein
MSLNGLDDVKLKEAHDIAVAEPGGWYVALFQPSFTAGQRKVILG